MSILQEFKEFASRGNVVDMAVGVIIGGAFGKITASLVNDVIMPPIGILISGVNFKDLEIILKAASGDIPAVSIKYGLFINTVLEFVIVAFVVFLMVKGINALRRKEETAPAPEPVPSKEETLLTDIRDILKNKS